jgi:dolichol-phosphate mannosyltransferase
MITGMKIMDTTAGFKCYKRELLKNIKTEKIKSIGYGFQIEMKFITWKLGYKIVEVPSVFTDRKHGASKMTGGIFNEALWGVLGMRIRSIFTKYPK